MIFLSPVYVGERVEITAEVTYVGRTSIETKIEIYAEPIEVSKRRRVATGYALYVALDESGRRPRPVPPLLIDDDAGHLSALARQSNRLARRAEAREHGA
jgi:acyl-CoA hydrolase